MDNQVYEGRLRLVPGSVGNAAIPEQDLVGFHRYPFGFAVRAKYLIQTFSTEYEGQLEKVVAMTCYRYYVPFAQSGLTPGTGPIDLQHNTSSGSCFFYQLTGNIFMQHASYKSLISQSLVVCKLLDFFQFEFVYPYIHLGFFFPEFMGRFLEQSLFLSSRFGQSAGVYFV